MAAKAPRRYCARPAARGLGGALAARLGEPTDPTRAHAGAQESLALP